MSRLCGIWGRPFIDLEPFVDTSAFDAIDDEIMLGLPRVEASYTGGTLKWMGVVAPWVDRDPYVDAMRVIEGFDEAEFVRFVTFAEDPACFDPARRAEYRFGDETEHPLTRAQMLYLKYRYGVYFPWKVCYHFLENDRWEDKHSGEGKDFAPEAREIFPKTVAFLEGLPFTEIGRCVLFGIEANDHAPAHRDSEPGKALSIAQSISFDPRGNKGFFLASPDGDGDTEARVKVDARAYWFNDMDYHGVEAAPRFRYSVRVDGVFDPAFVDAVRASVTRRR